MPSSLSTVHCPAGGIVEIFLFILVAGVTAHFIGASVHEGIFVGALVSHCLPDLVMLLVLWSTLCHCLLLVTNEANDGLSALAQSQPHMPVTAARGSFVHCLLAAIHWQKLLQPASGYLSLSWMGFEQADICPPHAGLHVFNFDRGQVLDRHQVQQLASWADHNRHAHPAGAPLAHCSCLLQHHPSQCSHNQT